jgi:hypothetical protein
MRELSTTFRVKIHSAPIRRRAAGLISLSNPAYGLVFFLCSVCAEEVMLLMRCDVLATGPGPSERVVGIETIDGKEEIVLHSSAMINQDQFEVGILGYENDRVLVELPRESASGRWRVWVPRASLLSA